MVDPRLDLDLVVGDGMSVRRGEDDVQLIEAAEMLDRTSGMRG